MAQDDDSFGLPDLNYKPLEPKPETPPPPPPRVERKPEPPKQTGRIQTAGTPNRVIPKAGGPEDEKSNTSVIVGILVPILILVGGYFGYVYLYKKPKEKAAIEAKIKADKDKKDKEEAARLAKLKADEEARLRAEEEARNAKPAIGTIETLSAKTGRFYVIVSSSIDGDLIMDEAQRMSARGVSTKIIPPFGKWKFYRLTISDQDTFALAQTKADESKAEFGSGLWVMRY
jgi:hypothetical protein